MVILFFGSNNNFARTSMNRGVADTTTSYDHIGDSNDGGNLNISASGLDGTKGGIRIESGSAAIGTDVKFVSMSLIKFGSPTGNFTFEIIDTDNSTVLSTASSSASGLVDGTNELELDTQVTLAEGMRVVMAYTGGNSSNGVLIKRGLTVESGYTRTLYNYSPAWTESTTHDILMTFDSSPTG